MNSIQKFFVEAYEEDLDITPKDLLHAGWTYNQLVQYMHCCSSLRSISMFWNEVAVSDGDKEHIKEKMLNMIKIICQELSSLVDCEVNLTINRFLSRSWIGEFFPICVENNFLWRFTENEYIDEEVFAKLHISDAEVCRIVARLIGKYIQTGYSFTFVEPETYEDYSVYQAQNLLDKYQNRLSTLHMHAPSLDSDTLDSFENIASFAKPLGHAMQEKRFLEDEIGKLQSFLEDPQYYKKVKKEAKQSKKEHDARSRLFAGRKHIHITTEKGEGYDSSHILFSVYLSHIEEKSTKKERIFIVDDAKLQDNDTIWVNRSLSKAILTALLQDTKNFYCKGKQYQIVEFTIVSSAGENFLLTRLFNDPDEIKTVYVYSFKQISDIENRYEAVTAYVCCTNTEVPVPINVYYDSNTDTYFINDITYQQYASKYGLPMMKLKPYQQSNSKGRMELADISPLRLYGYTVAESNGLSTEQRENLLANLIDSDLMSKVAIKNHIEWLLNMHEGNIFYEDACQKWMQDLKFVDKYHINNQRIVWATVGSRK